MGRTIYGNHSHHSHDSMAHYRTHTAYQCVQCWNSSALDSTTHCRRSKSTSVSEPGLLLNDWGTGNTLIAINPAVLRFSHTYRRYDKVGHGKAVGVDVHRLVVPPRHALETLYQREVDPIAIQDEPEGEEKRGKRGGGEGKECLPAESTPKGRRGG